MSGRAGLAARNSRGRSRRRRAGSDRAPSRSAARPVVQHPLTELREVPARHHDGDFVLRPWTGAGCPARARARRCGPNTPARERDGQVLRHPGVRQHRRPSQGRSRRGSARRRSRRASARNGSRGGSRDPACRPARRPCGSRRAVQPDDRAYPSLVLRQRVHALRVIPHQRQSHLLVGEERSASRAPARDSESRSTRETWWDTGTRMFTSRSAGIPRRTPPVGRRRRRRPRSTFSGMSLSPAAPTRSPARASSSGRPRCGRPGLVRRGSSSRTQRVHHLRSNDSTSRTTIGALALRSRRAGPGRRPSSSSSRSY